jgi:WXG100 family type VII secretion target
MPTYGLNPNGLLDTSTELDGITRNLQTAIDDLNGVVTQYVNANSGGTRDAFEHAQTTWNNGMRAMHASLGNAKQRLDEIHDSYQLGQAHGAQLFYQGHV